MLLIHARRSVYVRVDFAVEWKGENDFVERRVDCVILLVVHGQARTYRIL